MSIRGFTELCVYAIGIVFGFHAGLAHAADPFYRQHPWGVSLIQGGAVLTLCVLMTLAANGAIALFRRVAR